jgi:hypothetical protein
LIIAAASAWLAWRQVAIITDDRNIPFKTALYAECINLIRDTTQAMAKFEDSAVCVDSGAQVERLFGPSTTARRKCVNDVSSSFRDLEVNLKKSISMWPQPSRKSIVAYLLKAGELNYCGSLKILAGGRPIVGLKVSARCAPKFDDDFRQPTGLGFAAQRSMMNDLNALSEKQNPT